MSQLSPTEVADYLLDLGSTLLSYGCPTHRLEGLIAELAATEGCIADTFAMPTGLFLSVRGGDGVPVVRMTRVSEWGVNLDRLMIVDRIFNDVSERKITIQEARHRLEMVDHSKSPYPAWLEAIAPAGATAAGAVFFRGTWTEVALAAVGGLVLSSVGMLLSKRTELRFLGDFLGAVFATLFAWLMTRIQPGLHREVLVLSTIILLVPGMSLTTGLSELAHKNLVSGGGRVAEALVIFLSILFGVALVVGIEQAFGISAVPASAREGLGATASMCATLFASLCFGVLFRLPYRFLPAAVLSGALAWGSTSLGHGALPGHVTAFIGATTVVLVGNGLARWSGRPAQAFYLPGMILLVPGSFGFLSLEAFLRGEFLGGAAKGFEMFLVGGALVTGMLMANVVLPARKYL